VIVRPARPETDAAAVADIYRPAVTSSLASFEERAPTTEEMAERMRATLARTPWLVAEQDGTVVGYAYAGPHQQRPGYRWSVNISVYVAPRHSRRGIGRRLYDELLSILRRQGFVNAYAGITLPNAASVGLHESMGFVTVAVYPRVGFKFGRWHDTTWLHLRLVEEDTPPVGDPMPAPELWRDPSVEPMLAACAKTIRPA